jgi:hypothetical protein
MMWMMWMMWMLWIVVAFLLLLVRVLLMQPLLLLSAVVRNSPLLAVLTFALPAFPVARRH